MNTGSNYTPSGVASLSAGSYDYFVECEDVEGCVSTIRASVQLTVDPAPSAPSIDDQTICENGTIINVIPANSGGSTFEITGSSNTVGPANNFDHADLVSAGLDDATIGTYTVSYTHLTLPTILLV